MADQEEAEARSVDLSVVVVVHAVELLEDLAQVLLRNSKTLVLNAEEQRVALAGRVDNHVAAVRRVLDRVVEQVRENLVELVLVANDDLR